MSSVYILHVQHILMILMAKSSHHPLLFLRGTCNSSFMNGVLFLNSVIFCADLILRPASHRYLNGV